MKLLCSNFYIIAMLRVRMREINQTRKKKFWRRRSHKWRGIFSLWLNCIAEDHPPFQSEQKNSRRFSLTLPQPWHSNVLRVFCLFILMLVWVRLAQYSRKPCWYDTIDHWYTAKGGRRPRHPLHLARSTNNFWWKRGNKICHRYQWQAPLFWWENSNSQEWSNKSLLTGLRVSELHKRNNKREIPEWCHKCTDPWPLCFP